jgi:hypothetical protein
VSAATNIASSVQYDLAALDSGAGLLTNVHHLGVNSAIGRGTGGGDRDHLLERLHHLRTILPVFAQELASSRRQAAVLRVENRGLVDEVRRLRAQRGDSSR